MKIKRGDFKKVRELLRDKEARDESGLFVAEGEKMVSDIIAKGIMPEFVLTSNSFFQDMENRFLLGSIEERNIPAYTAGDADLGRISSLRSSQGILAVMKKPSWPEDAAAKNPFLVLCDGVQDPGNLGTVIRASLAFKAGAVLLSGESVDVYNPKVVRASAGSVLDIPVYPAGESDLDDLKGKGFKLFVSMAGTEGHDIEEFGVIPNKVIVAFGSEGRGISPTIFAKADEYFYIPVDRRIESLNVSTAAAITLYEFAKRRK